MRATLAAALIIGGGVFVTSGVLSQRQPASIPLRAHGWVTWYQWLGPDHMICLAGDPDGDDQYRTYNLDTKTGTVAHREIGAEAEASIFNNRFRAWMVSPNRHSHSVPCDGLCLRNESAHLCVFANKRDRQIDASAVTESREILRRGFPHHQKAIDAGFRIVALLNQRKSNSTIRKLRSYVGKRAAFYCLLQPPEMVVSGTMKNHVRTTVIVHFEPSLKRQPIIMGSSIVCVIKSIDIDKRIIRVEASPEGWRIVGTG